MILLYTVNQCRGQAQGSEQDLRMFALKTDRWALYREYVNGRRFHNGTDQRYLVDHDDTYWHNRERREQGE